MEHLCFASYARILLYKAPRKTTNKFFCGTLLMALDKNYDLRTDDDTVSKLLSGAQNVPENIVNIAKTADPIRVEQYFESQIIPMINSAKKKYIVLALKELIISDTDVDPDTQLGKSVDIVKKSLPAQTIFAFTEFLVNIFLYTIAKTTNRGATDAKQITRNYCDKYENRLDEITVYDLPEVRSVPVIPLTIKYQKFEQIFTMVAEDKLSNYAPNSIKLYRLRIHEEGIDYSGLQQFLLNIIGEYVHSRIQIKEIYDADEYGTIAIKALSLMLNKGTPDEESTGNELGELLLYVFLECVLQAPKLMSKIELTELATNITSLSDGIHLLVSEGNVPFNQIVFGASRMDHNLVQAADTALSRIVKIRDNRNKEYELVETRILRQSFDRETSAKIHDIIVPKKGKIDRSPMAFGVFLGYTLGVKNDIATCINKMESDIRECMKYMKQQIQNLGLIKYSFYVYVVPFNDVLFDKKQIMENLVNWRT